MFFVVSIWCHQNHKIWTVIFHKWNKLEFMICSWIIQKNKYVYHFIFVSNFFCFDLLAIYVWEIEFYLPTVLLSNCSCTNCSRCDPRNESELSNLELAAAGSPDMQLHSTAQDSQCHSISARSEQHHGMLVLIFLLMEIIIINKYLLNLGSWPLTTKYTCM